MSTLAPDEKVCPFCAETIKKAAIRCRYCQSDLADGEHGEHGAEAAEAPVVDEPPAPAYDDEPVEPVDETPAGPSFLSSLRLMIGLLVLCLVLAGVTAFAYLRDRDANAAPKGGVITSAGARDAGLTAAATLTQKVFSYNWTTFDKDAAASEAVMAPTFRKEYAGTLAKARANAIKSQVKQVATVSSTSVMTASADRVQALVFMNILTTGKAGRQNVTTSRLVVTLTRDGEEWRISAIKPI